MLGWMGNLIDRLFALTGALLFAQFPQFFLQYLHQLSGHVSELTYQVNLLEQTAKLSNKSVQELIVKFVRNADPDIVRQGDMMRSLVERLDSFTTALNSLQNASLFSKPFLFIRHVNAGIAQDTWQKFQLGFSFTVEGLVYAFIGMLVGYALFQLLRRLAKLCMSGVAQTA